MSPVTAAALIVFLEGLVLWAVFPVTSFYCEQLGGGPPWVGLMFALLSLPKVVSNPIFGRWSDLWGRRPMLVLASAGTLAGSVGWALAPTLGWLAISRLLAGLFSAQATLCQSVVVDATHVSRRPHALGLIGAAFGLSMVLGPLCGGWTAFYISHAAVGWMCAVFQTVSLAIALLALPETRPARRDPSPAARTAPPAGASLRVVQLLVVTFLMALIISQFTSTVSMLMDRVYHFSEVGASQAFAAFGMVGVLVQGGLLRLLLRWARSPQIAAAGFACLAAGFAIVAMLPPLRWLLAGVTLVGIGAGLTMPTVTALLSTAVHASVQGVVLGSQQSVLSLARGVGAAIAGGLYQWTGPGLSYASASVLGLVALLVLSGLRSPEATAAAPGGAGSSPRVLS